MGRWKPDDRQIVQLLVNRGELDAAQLEFARAYALLDGHASVLAAVLACGYVDRACVERALREALEDQLLRGLIRRNGLLGASQLVRARELQRGSGRSLLRTLVEEGLCPPALRRRVLAATAGGR